MYQTLPNQHNNYTEIKTTSRVIHLSSLGRGTPMMTSLSLYLIVLFLARRVTMLDPVRTPPLTIVTSGQPSSMESQKLKHTPWASIILMLKWNN